MSRSFLCRCEDVDVDEVKEAIHEGHGDLESLRRFTAIGTGPCQGKACIAETIRLLADHHGVPEAEIGQMTLRPPYAPIPLGLLAALPPDALEDLLDDEEQEKARATREALESQEGPRTGRATPRSIRDSLAKHRRLMQEEREQEQADKKDAAKQATKDHKTNDRGDPR